MRLIILLSESTIKKGVYGGGITVSTERIDSLVSSVAIATGSEALEIPASFCSRAEWDGTSHS
jgi:hypothetical protein